MGIHGIYKEIGPGRRVALSKLAVEKFEEKGRPLRIAIDVSIWLFQIQASKGGTNPALRTFYYRLLRLISLSIHPIFVFDGPNKPPFKRNKRTGPTVASIPEFLAKQLLKQFGFPIHLAPGEAEAECALLQKEGVVDAVLSEDVDTLMFGSGVTIRNWSPEQSSSKTPTHVNVYDAVETKNGSSGLDREGMILVALMSGGDYVPEGIPGIGPKTACEAARAGFGHDLCKIARNDKKAIKEWRERLQHEINTNESKLFARKRPSMRIPDDFPRTDILGYYTHPAISSNAGLDKLKKVLKWDQDLDFVGLRSFVYDAFDWVNLEGAKHFIRSLAPSLFVQQLRLRSQKLDRLPTDDIQVIEEDEGLLVKGIHGKRQHAITDNCTELRVSFTPIELVTIDLSGEEPDEEVDEEADADEELPLEIDDDGEAGPKKRGPTKFDPTKPVRVWVMESYVKVGVPLKVQDWEAGRRRPIKPQRTASANDAVKPTAKPRGGGRNKTTGSAPQASIGRFAKVTKPGVKSTRAGSKAKNVTPDPVDTLQAAPKASAAVVSLLSSSPMKGINPVPPQPSRERSLSPVPELPSSINKRRHRPMRRSHTMPEHSLNRSNSPSMDTIETLDLVDLPTLPSPSPALASKAETRTKRNASTSRTARDATITASPSKMRQGTLDMWKTLGNTSTKPRRESPLRDTAPISLAPQFEVETLDLTLTSPLHSLLPPQPTVSSRPTRTEARPSVTRPPLVSKTSNTSSTSSTASTSTKPSKHHTSTTAAPRRFSPRLRKTKSASPEIESLDLTRSSPPHAPPADEVSDVHPSRVPSSPPPLLFSSPEVRRSPRGHAASAGEASSRRASPPAAWKAQAKKKREIILRKSLAGSWAFVEAEGPEKKGGEVPRDKARRRWRESEIEVLDLC